MPSPDNRLSFIDGLRGIAALMVVCVNWCGPVALRRWPALHPLVDCGRNGVPIFFVISGFVICYSLRNTVVTRPTSARFILRRAVRLNPPYWAVIVITLLVGVSPFTKLIGYTPISWSQFAANMTYTQGLVGFSHYWDVFWTLCLEVQFYLLFVLLRFTSDRLRIPLALIASPLFIYSLCSVWRWPDYDPNPSWPLGSSSWIGGYFASFYLGILTCLHFTAPTKANRRILSVALALTAVRLAVAFELPLCFGLATTLLVHFSALRGGIDTWLSGRVFQFLGRISYSLYLWHIPAFFWVSHVAHSFPITAISAVFVSIAAYYLIELPSVRLSKRIRVSQDDR